MQHSQHRVPLAGELLCLHDCQCLQDPPFSTTSPDVRANHHDDEKLHPDCFSSCFVYRQHQQHPQLSQHQQQAEPCSDPKAAVPYFQMNYPAANSTTPSHLNQSWSPIPPTNPAWTTATAVACSSCSSQPCVCTNHERQRKRKAQPSELPDIDEPSTVHQSGRSSPELPFHVICDLCNSGQETRCHYHCVEHAQRVKPVFGLGDEGQAGDPRPLNVVQLLKGRHEGAAYRESPNAQLMKLRLQSRNRQDNVGNLLRGSTLQLVCFSARKGCTQREATVHLFYHDSGTLYSAGRHGEME